MIPKLFQVKSSFLDQKKPRKQKTKKASTKDNLFSFGHKFVVTPEHRSGVLLRVIKHIFKLKQTARVSEKC